MSAYGITTLDRATAQTVRYLIDTRDHHTAIDTVTRHANIPHTDVIMWESLTQEQLEKWRTQK